MEKRYKDIMDIPGTIDADKKNYGDELYGLKGAFAFANACRDKEIDRFWSRGLYFWGFIVASFGAYIALLTVFVDKIFSKNNTAVLFEDWATFLPFLGLTIISFVCFMFCLSWTLIHKGSKFWQENWETHLDFLEQELIGNMYSVFRDSRDKNNNINGCIFSPKAYNYSVSKISFYCSLMLTILSFCFFFAHILFSLFICLKITMISKILIAIIVLVALLLIIVAYCENIKGVAAKKTKQSNSEKSDTTTSNINFLQKIFDHTYINVKDIN